MLSWRRDLTVNYQLYLLVLLPVAYIFVFMYIPSTVVMVGMLFQFLSPRIGFVNDILAVLGFERMMFLSEPALFSSVYVWSGIWQFTGWNSIIYLAALSTVDPGAGAGQGAEAEPDAVQRLRSA